MKRSIISLLVLVLLSSCSPNEATLVVPSLPSNTPSHTQTPAPTATSTPDLQAGSEAAGNESVDVVIQEYMGHTIRFEMEQSYLQTNENTVSGIMDALLGALIAEGGEYGGEFASVEEFVKWIYREDNPDGPGNLRFQRPVDDPNVVQTPGVNNNQVVWEDQPVWDLDKGVFWETDFDATSVPKDVQSESPSYWGDKLWSVTIVDEQNRLHVYTAQDSVAGVMAHAANTDAENLNYLLSIPNYCLRYFNVLAHYADGASAVTQGYEEIPVSEMRQLVKTWFNYDIEWAKD
jgi:hypothetical protein